MSISISKVYTANTIVKSMIPKKHIIVECRLYFWISYTPIINYLFYY